MCVCICVCTNRVAGAFRVALQPCLSRLKHMTHTYLPRIQHIPEILDHSSARFVSTAEADFIAARPFATRGNFRATTSIVVHNHTAALEGGVLTLCMPTSSRKTHLPRPRRGETLFPQERLPTASRSNIYTPRTNTNKHPDTLRLLQNENMHRIFVGGRMVICKKNRLWANDDSRNMY